MAKPKAIVVWFDDNTSYHIDPSTVSSIFINETAAKNAGRPGPHRMPEEKGPIRGPYKDTPAPPYDGADAMAATTAEGTCYYVNGIIVCP